MRDTLTNEKMFKIYTNLAEFFKNSDQHYLGKDGFYHLISDGRIIGLVFKDKIVLQQGGLK